MFNRIQFKKIWEDEHLIECYVECKSKAVEVKNNIYTSAEIINKLYGALSDYCNNNVKTCFWENIEKKQNITSYISLSFKPISKTGHILIEVCMENGDSESEEMHRCCFRIKTELGLVSQFKDSLRTFASSSIGSSIYM